jgi:hypothetical protein
MSTEEKQAVEVPEETPKEKGEEEPKEEEESTATFEPVVSTMPAALFPRSDRCPFSERHKCT